MLTGLGIDSLPAYRLGWRPRLFDRHPEQQPCTHRFDRTIPDAILVRSVRQVRRRAALPARIRTNSPAAKTMAPAWTSTAPDITARRIRGSSLKIQSVFVAAMLTSTPTRIIALSIGTTPLGLLVQICTKFWHPHTFLCDDANCSGKYPSGNPFWSPGEILDDSPKKSSAYCADVPTRSSDPQCFDKCVAKEISNRGPSGDHYNFEFANCGQWAEDVIDQCLAQCAKE